MHADSAASLVIFLINMWLNLFSFCRIVHVCFGARQWRRQPSFLGKLDFFLKHNFFFALPSCTPAFPQNGTEHMGIAPDNLDHSIVNTIVSGHMKSYEQFLLVPDNKRELTNG